VFCGRDLLLSELRRSNIDASAGAVDAIAGIVARIRWRGEHPSPCAARHGR
jgi:hypothetical protein